MLVGEDTRVERVRRGHGSCYDGARAQEAFTSRAKALAGVGRKRKLAFVSFNFLLLCILFTCLLFQSALLVSMWFSVLSVADMLKYKCEVC